MSAKQDLRMVGIGLIAGLLGGVVSSWVLVGAPAFAQKAPPQEKVLQAERFVVVDPAGKLRAVLGLAADDSLSLRLYDQAGKQRLALGVLADGSPSLLLKDPAGKPRAGLLVKADGSPSLGLYDQAGKQRLTLGILPP